MRLRKKTGSTVLWSGYYIEAWNLGVASTSVWPWEGLDIGKIGNYQGQPNQK